MIAHVTNTIDVVLQHAELCAEWRSRLNKEKHERADKVRLQRYNEYVCPNHRSAQYIIVTAASIIGSTL